MANIVSVEWNVEDLRRVIDEQSQLSEAKPSVAKTVEVVSLEIAPASKTREESPALPHTEVALPKTTDLPSPKFVDEAVATKPRGTPTLGVNDCQANSETALEVSFEIVDGGKPGNKSPDEIVNSSGVAATGVDERITADERLEAHVPELTEQPADPKPSKAPSVPMDPVAPPLFAALEVKPKVSPLQGALGQPDIATGRATRDTTTTLYRGVEISMVKCAPEGSWRWSVRVGQPSMLRVGEAPNEQQAELKVRSVIDRAIAVEETLQRLKSGDRANSDA